MAQDATTGRWPVVLPRRSHFCLLMWSLMVCYSIPVSVSFVTTFPKHTSKFAIHSSSYNTGSRSSKLYMSSPSLDDAVLLGTKAFQAMIEAGPIGLPIAGLLSAIALSKSGLQQQKEWRTEVEQVQNNIVKMTDDAAMAGKASTYLIAISVFSTILSIGNVITMFPRTDATIVSNTDSVVVVAEKQVAISNAPNRYTDAVVEVKSVPSSDILVTPNDRKDDSLADAAEKEGSSDNLVASNDKKDDALANSAEKESVTANLPLKNIHDINDNNIGLNLSDDTKRSTNTKLPEDDDLSNDVKLSNDIKSSTSAVDSGKLLSSETVIDSGGVGGKDINKDEFKNAGNKPSKSTDASFVQHEKLNGTILPVVAVTTTKIATETALDSLVNLLQQYKIKELITEMMESFIRELKASVMICMQVGAQWITNDPMTAAFTNQLLESKRMIETSIQLVIDRLPMDSEPFVKGFLLGTLLLNVFNEGQKYDDDVYSMYNADEKSQKNIDEKSNVATNQNFVTSSRPLTEEQVNTYPDYVRPTSYPLIEEGVNSYSEYERPISYPLIEEEINTYSEFVGSTSQPLYDGVSTNVRSTSQPLIETADTDVKAVSLDEDSDNGAVVGKVKALAEVLISKRIVQELLQKKEKKKPYFATSAFVENNKQNYAFPQPPRDKPPIDIFNADLRKFADKSSRTSFGLPFVTGRSRQNETPNKADLPSWSSPFQRKSVSQRKDDSLLPVNSISKDFKTNGFVSWFSNLTKPLPQPPKDSSVSTSTGETLPTTMPSKFQPTPFDFNTYSSRPIPFVGKKPEVSDPSYVPQNDNVRKEFLSDYDFVVPSMYEKIVDSDIASDDPMPATSQKFGDTVEQESPTTLSSNQQDTPSTTERESYKNLYIPPIRFINDNQETDLIGNVTNAQIEPFNVPFTNDSSTSRFQWTPPDAKQTSYSAAADLNFRSDNSKAVEFKSAFDATGYRSSRFDGSNQGTDNASAFSPEPYWKSEVNPPIEYDNTLRAFRKYGSESSQTRDGGTDDKTKSRPPGQPGFDILKDNEYTQQTPLDNASFGGAQNFEFPGRPEVEPTFSALNLYGEMSPALPPTNDLSTDFISPPPEYIEPTFNAFDVYSVAPVTNDVASASKPEVVSYKSPDTQPTFDPPELYNMATNENQENPAPVTIDSKSRTETSFDLSDVFNEKNLSHDSDVTIKSQEAINIPTSENKSQESVEPTFSAIDIYSAAPVTNDVSSTSMPDTSFTNADTQPTVNPPEMYDVPANKNQAIPASMPFDSKSGTDLFDEQNSSRDSEKAFESQEAVNIPIADVLPPSYEVDIDASGRSQDNPYEDMSMFSILPDMSDIFSSRPSYTPYSTRQPEQVKASDLAIDAIDTPIDVHPILPDTNDFLVLAQSEVLGTPKLDESSTDVPLSDKGSEETTEPVEKAIDIPLASNSTTSRGHFDSLVLSSEEVLEQSPCESRKSDLPTTNETSTSPEVTEIKQDKGADLTTHAIHTTLESITSSSQEPFVQSPRNVSLPTNSNESTADPLSSSDIGSESHEPNDFVWDDEPFQ